MAVFRGMCSTPSSLEHIQEAGFPSILEAPASVSTLVLPTARSLSLDCSGDTNRHIVQPAIQYYFVCVCVKGDLLCVFKSLTIVSK